MFGYLETEDTVQISDRTRLSAVKSFAPKGSPAITKVEIEPEAGAGFVDVTGQVANPKGWFLDWQYDAAGAKVVSLRITDATSPTPIVTTITKTVTVISEADDMLFSGDEDLRAMESDVLRYVPEGRNSFLNVHRKAQSAILDWLDDIRVYGKDGARLTKADLSLTEDLNKLSTMWVLEMIFFDLSNKPDDAFMEKSLNYRGKRESAQARGRIQADFNKDGTQEKHENVDMVSHRMIRR